MTCDHVRERLLDRLDDLLDASEAAEVDVHVADCPPCAAEAERLGRLRARLATPWAVGPAPRLLAVRSSPARRLAGLVAAFAAGVLVAGLLFRAEPGPTRDLRDTLAAPPPSDLPPVVAPSPAAPPAPEFALTSPRRIR